MSNEWATQKREHASDSKDQEERLCRDLGALAPDEEDSVAPTCVEVWVIVSLIKERTYREWIQRNEH